MGRKFMISVIGGHKAKDATLELAEEIGKAIGESGAVLVSGGLSGTMEAVSRGAKTAGGITVGIIPGENSDEANTFVDIAIATGMGYSRNTLVAGTSDMIVALPGEYGTLSEIAFSLNGRKPVYGFDTWDIPGVVKLGSVDDLRNIIRDKVKVNSEQ